jgi:chemosensory pili system protein ChpA (sensor histidine kinase/response regulator)
LREISRDSDDSLFTSQLIFLKICSCGLRVAEHVVGYQALTPQETIAMSVLIVDDHLSLQTLLTLFLEDIGYEARTANNGAEALSYLQQSTNLPGLILLDIAMPKMTGWEFLRHQQRDSRLSAIPVVVMSALAHVDYEKQAPSAVAVIGKPIELHDLAEVVHTHYRPQLMIRAVGG